MPTGRFGSFSTMGRCGCFTTHAPRFPEEREPLATPPPQRRAWSAVERRWFLSENRSWGTPLTCSHQRSDWFWPVPGARDHKRCRIGYLYGTPPVPRLEPRKPGRFSFFAPAVEDCSGPIEAADHSSAHLDRQPVPLRKVLAYPGEPAYQVILGPVRFAKGTSPPGDHGVPPTKRTCLSTIPNRRCTSGRTFRKSRQADGAGKGNTRRATAWCWN